MNQVVSSPPFAEADFDAKVTEAMRQLKETRASVERTMESLSRQQEQQAATCADLQKARLSLDTHFEIAKARFVDAAENVYADLGHSDLHALAAALHLGGGLSDGSSMLLGNSTLPSVLAGSSLAPFCNSTLSVGTPTADNFSPCVSALVTNNTLGRQVHGEKQDMLDMVIAMGFGETRAQQALTATSWTSVEAALDAAMQVNQVDEQRPEMVEQLKSFGIGEQDARTALETTRWSGVEDAMALLFPN